MIMMTPPSPASRLRDMQRLTGAPLVECKRALVTGGRDLTHAMNLLAEAGFTGGRPVYDPAERRSYGFDIYGMQVASACQEALADHLSGSDAALTRLVLRSRQGGPVDLVSAYTRANGREGETIAHLDLDIPSDFIPECSGAEDFLLRAYLYRTGLSPARPDTPDVSEEEPALQWEFSSLPTCLFCYEMLCCARSVVGGLSRDGIAVTPDCAAAYVYVDYFLDAGASDSHLADIRARMAKTLPPASVEDFARLCYETPEKRRWLVGLL